MNMILDKFLVYLLVFLGGGLLCSIGQLLIIKTKLTPARILVIFLVTGIILEGFGLFKYIKQIFNSGVTVPILGFGASLAKGTIKYALEFGVLGAFAGGLIQTAAGVGVAIVLSFLVTVIFRAKTK